MRRSPLTALVVGLVACAAGVFLAVFPLSPPLAPLQREAGGQQSAGSSETLVPAGGGSTRSEAPAEGGPVVSEATGDGAALELRVVDAEGAATALFELVLSARRLHRPHPYGGFEPDLVPAELDAAQREPRTFVRARTGGDGSVRVADLAAGTFHVYARMRSARDSFGRLEFLGAATASETPEETVFRLDRAQLTVALAGTGEAGRAALFDVYDAGPVAGAPYVRNPGRYAAWPVDEPVRTAALSPEAVRAVTFELTGGRHYFVVQREGARHGRPELVSLGAAPSSVRITVDPQALGATARIAVRVRSAETGERLGKGGYRVWIEDAGTAIPFAAWAVTTRKDETPPLRPYEVPAGRLRVVVEADPRRPASLTGFRWAERLGRAEAVLDVAPGDEREVELVLGLGGRLEVDVRGADSLEDDLRWEGHVADFASESDASIFQQRDLFNGAELVIESADRRLERRAVHVGRPSYFSTGPGLLTFERWPLGETHTSEVLPVGTYTLRATQGTRAPIERSVTIEPGETTRVVLDFGG